VVRVERRTQSTMGSRQETRDRRPKAVQSRTQSLKGAFQEGEGGETGTCSPIDSRELRVIAG